MKKIAFMFAVAAMFVACGNGNKPAEEVATDSIAAKFQAVCDSIQAAAAADTTATDSTATDGE